MLNYAENHRNGSMFCVLDPPAGMTAAQMVTYVETTASLLESSEFGAIYWPRVKILNPRKDIFGNEDNIVVAPSGIICGVYARTDASQEGGIYQPPAGIERGILTGVTGFETDEVLKETVRDLVFPKRINPLTTDDGLPRFIDGPLTLKSSGNFPTVAERRGVIHIEQSVIIGTAFARHSNNDEALRARVERTTRAFLTEQMRVGAFRSKDPAKAFLVDVGPGLNTEAVIFSGKLIMRMGLATQKPALFIIIRVSQDTRALEEEIAGAA
jgi:phage tail sheath protein FI